MKPLYSNNAITTLLNAVITTDFTINVTLGASFPVPVVGEFFYITLFTVNKPGGPKFEIIKVNDNTANVFTIPADGRGHGGTVAQNWNAGDEVEMRIVTDILEYSRPNIYNYIINGNFELERLGLGTSFTVDGYGLAQWEHSEGDASGTTSRQSFTVGQTDVPGEPIYYYRHTRPSASFIDSTMFNQKMESLEDLIGPVRVGFWAKADSAFTFDVNIDQDFGGGGSATVSQQAQTFSVTSSWQYFSFAFTLPSISGKTIGTNPFVNLNLKEESPYNQFTLDIAQVQFHKGVVLPLFTRRPIQEEQNLAWRFYYPLGMTGQMHGKSISTTVIRVAAQTPVEMAKTPTVTLLDDTPTVDEEVGGAKTGTSSTITASVLGPYGVDIKIDGFTSMTDNEPVISDNGVLSPFAYLIAEL